MHQYLISHTYLTLDDSGTPVVETESVTADDASEVTTAVAKLLFAPGGRSGTTIALTVTPTSDNTLTI